MLSLVLSGSLFGTGGLLGSLLGRLAVLPPLAVAAYRLAAGGALIILFAVGMLAATAQGCYFAAVARTSVTLATLVTIGSMPVLVLAAERAVGRGAPCLPAPSALQAAGAEPPPPTGRMIAALALALVGLGLLVGLPSGGTLAGAVFAVAAAGAFAVLTMVGARPVAGLSELTTIGFGFAAGGLLLASVAGSRRFEITPASPGVFAGLAVAPTAVAYPLYIRGSRTVGAGTAAVLTLLAPLTAAVLAAVLLAARSGTP